ncbi:hypothetical protein LTR50_002874 [Elasticomyces elasticus]|nr:hypothetical protein LTR50_002874 [Elasticomyces elasticus]
MLNQWQGDNHKVKNGFDPSREHVDSDTTPRDDVPVTSSGMAEKPYPEEQDNKDSDVEKAASTPSHGSAAAAEEEEAEAAAAMTPGPPPDGGLAAWTQVLMAHIIIFNTWGYINSFGLFQTYYVATLGHPPSDVSWIGSVQVFLLFFIGTVSGRAADAGFFRITFAVGLALLLLGVFMTSLCTAYWQLFLAQGICTGLGNGLLFCPSLSVLSTYFSKHRAQAIGIAASGTATGGVVFPIIAQQLLPKVGFGWTVRVMGFIMAGTMIFPLIFVRARLPPRRTGPLVEWAAFRELNYSLYAAGVTLCFWGMYFAYYYIGAYGESRLGSNQKESITLLLVLNAAGVPGRLLPNWISDRFLGPLNTMIPFTLISALLLYCWISIASVPKLLVFAIFYGFFSSGMLSLFPAALTSLNKDPGKIGVRLGMVMSCLSFATLTGPPIGGAIIQAQQGGYVGAQVFFGSIVVGGAAFLAAVRISVSGWGLRHKV